jgi:hypothetical protein
MIPILTMVSFVLVGWMINGHPGAIIGFKLYIAFLVFIFIVIVIVAVIAYVVKKSIKR